MVIVNTGFDEDGEHVHMRFTKEEIDTLYTAVIAFIAHCTLHNDVIHPDTGMILYKDRSCLRNLPGRFEPYLTTNRGLTQ